ncbi:MAG: hypothetical protein C5B50_26035 [Verrucomicrobia bacterium]|nr:MAG: hypothetical protein C5B50_26035 [Verrucomicrobiota bacterium]
MAQGTQNDEGKMMKPRETRSLKGETGCVLREDKELLKLFPIRLRIVILHFPHRENASIG